MANNSHNGVILKRFFLIGSLLITASGQADTFTDRLIEAAKERTTRQVSYDGGYRSIDYPNGDVPDHLGVCTDLVIRAFRGAGVDLQRAVHEDMKANFDRYPSRRIWGLTGTDRNIVLAPKLQLGCPSLGSSSCLAEVRQAGACKTCAPKGDLGSEQKTSEIHLMAASIAAMTNAAPGSR